MRAVGQAPILVVSGESGEAAKVRALGLGADDYLTKPFGKAELLARIAAIMRRVDRSGGLGSTGGGPFVAGDLVLEPGRHEARVGGRSLALTPTEFRLLEALVRPAATSSRTSSWLAPAGPPDRSRSPVAQAASRPAPREGPGGGWAAGRRRSWRRVSASMSATSRRWGIGREPCDGRQRLTVGARVATPLRQDGDRSTRHVVGRVRAHDAAPAGVATTDGLKCTYRSLEGVRRQPHAAHVTGAPRPSRTATGWVSDSEGWSIRDLPGGSTRASRSGLYRGQRTHARATVRSA